MDRITRWEWHGQLWLLTLLALTGILLPVAIVYFMTNLLRIEENVPDATKLSDFIASRAAP